MDAVQSLLSSLTHGEPNVAGRLTVVPLLTRNARPADYILLEYGIEQGLVVVTETSDSGTVPDLFLKNAAEQPVLLLDGDVLTGAKQNRTLNLSMLSAPHSQVMIPVSCVEAGRWSRKSSAMKSSRHHMFASGRSQGMREVHRSMDAGSSHSDQQRVWSDIDRKLGDMGVQSETRAMTDLFDEVDSLITKCSPLPGQVGAIFAIDGSVVGMDCFEDPAVFASVHDKLLRSYGLEAISSRSGPPVDAAGTSEEFMKLVSQCTRSPAESPGTGSYLRLAGPSIVGAAVVLNEHVAHLCAFADQ